MTEVHPLFVEVRGKKHYKTKYCCAMPNGKETVRLDKVCKNPKSYNCGACDLVNRNRATKRDEIIKREIKRKKLANGVEYFSIPEDVAVPLIITDITDELAEVFCPSCNGSGKHVTRVDAFMWTKEEDLPICSPCKGKGKITVAINAKKCSNCGMIQPEYNTHCWCCKRQFSDVNYTKKGRNKKVKR